MGYMKWESSCCFLIRFGKNERISTLAEDFILSPLEFEHIFMWFLLVCDHYTKHAIFESFSLFSLLFRLHCVFFLLLCFHFEYLYWSAIHLRVRSCLILFLLFILTKRFRIGLYWWKMNISKNILMNIVSINTQSVSPCQIPSFANNKNDIIASEDK